MPALVTFELLPYLLHTHTRTDTETKKAIYVEYSFILLYLPSIPTTYPLPIIILTVAFHSCSLVSWLNHHLHHHYHHHHHHQWHDRHHHHQWHDRHRRRGHHRRHRHQHGHHHCHQNDRHENVSLPLPIPPSPFTLHHPPPVPPSVPTRCCSGRVVWENDSEKSRNLLQ